MGCGPCRSGPETRPDVGSQAGDDRSDGGIELGVGQGALVVAQGQSIGEALVAVGQRPAAVDVEQRHVAEQGSAMAPDGALHARGGRLERDDDGQVALDGKEP